MTSFPFSSLTYRIRLTAPVHLADSLRSALEQQAGGCSEAILATGHFDTANRHFARHDACIELRREAGQWIQLFHRRAADSLTRIEYLAPVDSECLDLSFLQGRPGVPASGSHGQLGSIEPHLQRRFDSVFEYARTVVTATADQQRSTVELALQVGELSCGSRRLPVCSLQFELLNGPVLPLLALAASWQQRHHLIIDPVGVCAAGDRLARRKRGPQVRRSRMVPLGTKDRLGPAVSQLFDECFGHIAPNCVALAGGLGSARHRHQCRVAMRRLRVLLRLCRGWIEPLPSADYAVLKMIHQALGAQRDLDVFRQELLPRLNAAGCPSLGKRFDPPESESDAEPTRAAMMDAQANLLALLQWRHCHVDGAGTTVLVGPKSECSGQALVRRRLRTWLADIQRRAARFDQMDETQRHALRKRIRRFRYGCRFAQSWLPADDFALLSQQLFPLQRALGEWCDLQLAMRLLQSANEADSAALQFANGWVRGCGDALDATLRPLFAALTELDIGW